MDSFNEYNKIPYDDTPIFRVENQKNRNNGIKNIKFGPIFLIIMIVLNVFLSITCYTYLKNGKIKQVNIYNDTYQSQEVTYMQDSMRSAKYHSVCVAAGLTKSGLASIIPGVKLNNNDFYRKTKSHGAGFLYKIEGDTAYFITCFHVINFEKDESKVSQTRIWVLPASMLTPIEVELVSYSEKDDVAVLKYTHSNIIETLEGCTPVSVYDSTFVSEYEDVFTIGNPLNYGFTATSGKITAYRQSYIDDDSNIEYYWMKTDAAINPGNSGGGLFNANGELIGMVNANIPTNSLGTPVNNTAFAIPGTLVVSIAENIIQNDLKHSAPSIINLGINLDIDEIMGVERQKSKYLDQYGNVKDLDQEYVIIDSFNPVSIAKSYGLKEKDRIVSIEIEMYGREGKIIVPILNKLTYYEYAYAIKPGSSIKFNIERQNSENKTIKLEIIVSGVKY